MSKRKKNLPALPRQNISQPNQEIRTEAKRSAHSLQIEASRFHHFQGPLPPPEILKAYDIVLPGLAERVICAWEKQTDHRIFLEKTVIMGDDKRANWGLICATIIAITVILASVAIAIFNKEQTLTAFAVIIADLAALAGIFVYGSRNRRIEREKKAAELMETTKSK